MPQTKKHSTAPTNDGATVGYEARLWHMADALRGSMDAAEYKHVVLGLIFLKYISDAFEAQHAQLEAEQAQGADPEDPDEYRALNIFWVPPEARWARLKAQAKQPTIGQRVDDAMTGIERDNASLKGVLPKDYARPALDTASCPPTARCRRTSLARVRCASAWSKPTLWTAWWRCRASSSTRRRFRRASGFSRATSRTASSAIAAATCSSLTPARWAAWWTAPTAS